MGQGDEARESFAQLYRQARNDGERRFALFWMAMSYVHEGQTEKALAEVAKMAKIAEATDDLSTLAGDYNQMGDILLEAGQPDAAATQFAEQLKAIDKAKVPAEVKQAAHRNALYDDVRVALAKGDVATASAKALEYAQQVAAHKIPFEVRQQHELAGRIALARQDFATAAAELEQANPRDPRVLYLLASALQAGGDTQKALETATRVADFNGLAANYAFVRGKAKRMLAGQ
jgi:tetratricopeptide (TPR) repeat protein